MLSALNITKSFSGVKALDDVCMDLLPGKVNAVIGENGAGKSTLMKVLSGVHTDYDGEITYRSNPVRFRNPREARDAGIAIIHQELNLVQHMTIVENIFLGREISDSWGFLDKKEMRTRTKTILEKLGIDIDPDTLISSLRVGHQQVVEIARALCFDAEVIIMDEPTSAITESEIDILFTIIDSLRRENKTIVYISHKLDELVRIADRYIVLRDGRSIESGDMNSISTDDIVKKMVGREIAPRNKQVPGNNDVILAVTNVSLKHPVNKGQLVLDNISFSLAKGEILGIFGLMGAGRTELLETLFGLHSKAVNGSVTVDGQNYSMTSVTDAIETGIALVPEDRKHDGLIADMDVKSNISITTLGNLTTRGLLDSGKELSLADQYIRDLKIKTDSPGKMVRNLSGGNQQKVVLAKWLATNPKVLLLDEPTRGIDVSAKSEIYSLISHYASQGLGVVFVSSELPELFAVTDRILVICEGKMTANVMTSVATESEILQAAIPGKTLTK